ncbi:T9SS type A sorting domain-containing protein [Winogradskyella sp. A3E31]|uniref:T9SS type A sorting domain-containing protein n=1 Tax=Winogradskyella sp. A3E31 TaxID=3349637 RepID=UPI00398B8743
MKKITFLSFLLIAAFSFSQELVTNGDFETGVATPWYGNAANVVDDGGGNFVNEANVTAAGTPFSVNLSQEIVLTSGLTYELTFDAYTDATTGTRGMVVGLGQTAAPFTAITENPVLTDTPQTFTYTITINYGDGVPDRVIFDMGAETGFVFIDNVSVQETVDLCNDGILNNGETQIDCGGPNCDACPNPPAGPPTVPPARDAMDVKSVYSNSYTQEPTDGFQTFGSAVVTELDYSGNTVLSVTTPDNGSGLQYQYFGTTPPYLDLSAMTNMHIDFFFEGSPSAVGTIFIVIAQYSDGTNIQKNFDVTSLASGTWHEMDVPFANFDGNPGYARDEIQQVIVQVAGADGSLVGPFYVDNLYFHNNMVLSADSFDLANINISPNPTKDSWNITGLNTTINTIEVFDILGKRVQTITPNNTEVTIDAKDLKSGIYLAKMYSDNGTKTIKLVKE